MTKPKQSGQCPICLKVLQHVSKHIREVHLIRNPTERRILNAIASGRVDVQKGTCPVPGCGLFRRRLSRHIEAHPDLLPGRREAYQQVARRDAGLKQLSELRATDPQPPMASVLDVDDSLASECRHPSCIQREHRIRELEAQLLFGRPRPGEVHPRTRPQEPDHRKGTSTQKRKRHGEGTSSETAKDHREGTSEKKRKRHGEGTSSEAAKDHREGTSTKKRKHHREGTSPKKAKDHREGTSTKKPKHHREGTSTKKPKHHREGTSTKKPKRHSVDEDRLRKRMRRIHVLESTDEEPAVALDLTVALHPEEPAVALALQESSSGADDIIDPDVVPSEPAVSPDPEEPAVALALQESSSGADDIIDPDVVPSEPAVSPDPEEPAVALALQESSSGADDIIDPDVVPSEPAVSPDPEEPAVALALQESSSGADDIIDPDVVPSEPAVSPDPEEPAVALDLQESSSGADDIDPDVVPSEPAVSPDPDEPAVAQDDVQESGQSGVSEPNHQLSSGDHDTIDPDIVPSEPAVPLDPEEPAVVLNPEVPAVALDPEEPAVALDPEEPAVALDPEEPAVAQDEDVKESEESGVSEPNLQESSGDDDDEFPLTAGEAAEEEETRLAVADNVREIAAADRDTMLGKSRGAGVLVHQALQKIFQGRCKGSTGDFKFPKAIADYMEQYGEHIFRPQGTRKVQENCISRTVRAKSFVAYMMFGSPKPHWDWGFMSNIEHLRAYPAVLRALKKKPNTAQTYFMQVRAFVEYFNNKVPKGCRLTGDQRTEVFWELQKVAKDTGRSIAAHQLAVKGQKQERLLSREALVRCTRLARERIPSLLV
uniref:Uncharacterized protein n=1 Tax=Knipowitschia caucasica TaxID=637954 RepID=A0AAV2LCU3_KNICA